VVALAAAAHEGRLLAFVGAGVSTIPPTSLLSWWDVNEQVVVALTGEVEGLVGRERAAAIVGKVIDRQRSGLLPPEYQAELVAGRLRDSYFRVLQSLDSNRPNRVHYRLARLAAAGSVAAIVTTNFDRALEAAFASIGSNVRVCVRSEDVEELAASLDRGELPGQPPVVLKLHGSAESPDTIIDTLAQRKRGFPPATVACLRRLLGTCHWLFLGYSGADLEADPGYLQLRGESARARGFTWLFRPDSAPGPALEETRSLYGDRGAIMTGELPAWLEAATAELVSPEKRSLPDEQAFTSRRRQAQDDFATEARAWARDIGPRRCTLALADVLAAVGEPQDADHVLARLYEALARDEPGGPGLATAAAALAGRRTADGRYAEALALYKEAFDLAESEELRDQAPWLRANMAEIAWMQGDLDSARVVFEEAVDLAARRGDDAARGVALHNLALVSDDAGEPAEATRLLLEEVEFVRRLGDEPSEAVALTALGDIERRMGRFDDALAHLDRALQIRRRLGDDIGAARVLGNVAGVHFNQGRLDDAAEIYAEGFDLFARLGDRRSCVTALGNLGIVSRSRGRYEEALARLQSALGEARELGLRGEIARLSLQEGAVVREAGDPQRSLGILEEALATAAGRPALRGLALNELGLTHSELGHLEEAGRAFREAADEHAHVGDDSERASALGNLAILETQRGRSEAALRLLDESMSIREQLGQNTLVVRGLLNLASTFLRFDRLDEALAGFRRALEGARQLDLHAEQASAVASIAYVLGLQGVLAESLRGFEEAERYATDPSDRERLAKQLEHLAEIYDANGYEEPAVRFAGEAVRLRGS
jgi:tetratricopeptide (TPR) repeat protein